LKRRQFVEFRLGPQWPLAGGWIGDRADGRASVLARPRTGSGANFNGFLAE
jgi:hypothetical protein